MASGTSFGLTTIDGRRPKVAIVCGNIASAAVTLMLCEQFGCAPHGAQTGEGALALLRRDSIDLVLLDTSISDMDPAVLAQLCRALGPRGGMPIVAIADRGSAMASPRSRAAGFAATVGKPFSPRELYDAMQGALARAGANAGAG